MSGFIRKDKPLNFSGNSLGLRRPANHSEGGEWGGPGRPTPEKMFDDLKNMSDSELKVKELLEIINSRKIAALSEANNYSVGSFERLQCLERAKALSDSLGDIIFTFEGAYKIYRQMLESVEEVQKL